MRQTGRVAGRPMLAGQATLGCLETLPKGKLWATEMCTQHRKGSSVYPDPCPGQSPQALRLLRPLPAWLQLLPTGRDQKCLQKLHNKPWGQHR